MNGRIARWQGRRQIVRIAGQVADNAHLLSGQAPVAFFNASARLDGLSQNAAFSLLTSWALAPFRNAGRPFRLPRRDEPLRAGHQAGGLYRPAPL